MVGLGFLIVCVLSVMVLLSNRRVKDLEERVQAQREAQSDLLRRISSLERSRVQTPPAPPPVIVTAQAPAPAPVVERQPVPAPPPLLTDPPASAPVAVHASIPPPLPPPPPLAAQPQAVRPMPPAPPRPAPPSAPRPSRLTPPPMPPRPAFDWESLVGVKLFSWIAGILFALTAILFMRYSVNHGWLMPPVRFGLGLLMGTGLLGLCEHRLARHYSITADSLGAAGIVALFSTFFAGHTLWHLVGAVPTFVLLVMVTVVAVVLAIRHDSLFIALLGLAGGFATPALLSTGEDHAIGLFGYLLLLNAGLAWVALRKSWPVLSILSLVFTTLYQWGWVLKFLDASKLPLAMGIFLVFPLLGLLAPALSGDAEGTDEPTFAKTALVGAFLPLLFGLYLATGPAYGAQYGLLFGFLFVLQAGIAAVAIFRGPHSLHSFAAGTTVLTFLLWFSISYSPKLAAWPAILGFIALFVLFDLAVPWLADRLDRPLGEEARPGTLAGPALLICFPVLIYLEPAAAAPGLPFAVLFALLAATAGFAMLYEDGLLVSIGAFFALAAEAVWSAQSLSPLRLVAGLSVYAVFGFFYLGVPIVARRLRRRLAPVESGVLPLLASFGFLFAVAIQPKLSIPPWPFLTALLLLGLAAGVAALWLRRSVPWISALAASDVILLAWMVTAGKAPWPAVALASALAVSALGLLWIALSRSVAGPGELATENTSGVIATLFFGQVLAIAAANLPGSPPLAFTIAGQVAFLLAILWLSVLADRPWLVPLSVVLTTAAVAGVPVGPRPGAAWWHELAFAGALYLPYLAFPLILGERARRLRQPYLAAVLASLSFFFFARHALLAGGYSGVIGALPVAQAAALAVLLAWLVRMERGIQEAERDPGRLALVAGAVLAGITAAIPLQLDREWITIAWALLAAALAALYLRIPHRGLLWWTAGLLGAVFVRLAANPAVLAYHPRSGLAIWNWYLYTYLVPAAAFFLAAWLLARGDDRLAGTALPRLSMLAASGGVVLLFLLVNIEIADFFSKGASLTFGFLTGQATLAEDLTYTLAWALFAIALFAAGIVRPNQPVRIAGIVLLLVAVLKGFVHDLAQLGGLYRVGSFAGLGVCLALMAVLIQKYVLPRREVL